MRFFLIIGAMTVCAIGAVGVWFLIKNITLKENSKGKRK